MFTKFRGAIHSTKISGNFGPKLNGSVRSNRKSFEKTGPPFEVVLFSRSDRSEFWLVLVQWIAPQMTSRISAVQEHTSDMRSAASAPVQVCPTNLKEPYKIGQATDQSKKMREPPQQVKQRSTKQFPPMTSNYADFPDRTVYEVPRSSSTLQQEFLSKERSYVNPCIAQRREHRSGKDTTSAFPTCEATTVTPEELYFSLGRSVLSYLCRKIPSQKISLYSLHSSQEKHEKEIHRNCNCHESRMFKYRLAESS